MKSDLIPAVTRRIAKSLSVGTSKISDVTGSEIRTDVRTGNSGSLERMHTEYIGERYSRARRQNLLNRINSDVKAATRYSLDELSKIDPSIIEKYGADQIAEMVGDAARRIDPYGSNHTLIRNYMYQRSNVMRYQAGAERVVSYLKQLEEQNNNDSNNQNQPDIGNGEGGEQSDTKNMRRSNRQDDGDGDSNSNAYGNSNDSDEISRSVGHGLIDRDDFERYIEQDMLSLELLSKGIDTIEEFSIDMTDEKISDPEGEDIDTKQLDIHRFMKMSSDGYVAMAMPIQSYFGIALSNGEIHMRDTITYKSRKPIELIMIDASDSMESDDRAKRALAYAINRIEKVISDKMIVAISFFTCESWKAEIDGVWILDNPDIASKMKSVIYNLYDNTNRSGGTDIPRAMKDAYQYAEEIQTTLGLSEQTSITIVTDDDTSSKGIEVDSRFKLNCIATSVNDTLRTICADTGGVYVSMNKIN